MMFVCLAYMGVNLAVTKYRDDPVYPVMDWDSPSGIGIPVGLILVGAPGLYFLLYWVFLKKLSRAGETSY